MKKLTFVLFLILAACGDRSSNGGGSGDGNLSETKIPCAELQARMLTLNGRFVDDVIDTLVEIGLKESKSLESITQCMDAGLSLNCANNTCEIKEKQHE